MSTNVQSPSNGTRHAGFDPKCPGCQKETREAAADFAVVQHAALGHLKPDAPNFGDAVRMLHTVVKLAGPEAGEDYLRRLNAPPAPRHGLSGHPSDFVGLAPEAYPADGMKIHYAAIETMKRHAQAGKSLTYYEALVLVTRKRSTP